ncbi:unnamed protein product [Rotaria magnacalcarata]|uniref:Uncharacterized protein n=1 Tax=Rotaria magnacalcarata TaxID=392030 RepID=A0A816YBT7_9BILA|nr:unnamed protein product [Rotaria magnacalcarata]CAF2156629.1 unnamed protein product [Rotaria magnacalcarata]CAF4130066.1 unnamed protein product [Rotaria magnacalcarata]CAF4156912.1 unnamed protein product [Rotaria magnacalcarata]
MKRAVSWSGCNVVFSVHIPRRFSHACSSIEDASQFKGEEEVLIQPYTCLRVINNSTENCNGERNLTRIDLVIESVACNLTGLWTCDDKEHTVQDVGTYFISHTINSNDELIIEWGNLPIARDKYSGQLKLQISSNYQTMTKTYDSNKVFCGTNFHRISNEYLDKFEIDKKTKWVTSDSELSGCWNGDDDSEYFIGICRNEIYWLGTNRNSRRSQ